MGWGADYKKPRDKLDAKYQKQFITSRTFSVVESAAEHGALKVVCFPQNRYGQYMWEKKERFLIGQLGNTDTKEREARKITEYNRV